MARVMFKQLCARCKKTMVLISTGTKFPLCYNCQKPELQGKITDPVMKKMFDIPEKHYEENSFLRSVKSFYLRSGRLSDKQLAAFKKVVATLSEKKE